MSKHRAVKIRNAHGGGYTSRKQAIKFLEQGRARYVDESTIEMIEDDYRHVAAIASAETPAPYVRCLHSARLNPVAYLEGDFPVETRQTFLRYPQKNQTSTRRLNLMPWGIAHPGAARRNQ